MIERARSRVFVKICGLTRVEDAKAAAEAGADAIGLNFVPSSPRRIDAATARTIAEAIRGRVEVFAVVADLGDDAIAAIVDAVGIDVVQLHGSESPDDADRIAALVEKPVIKAVRLATRGDLYAATRFRGVLLVDASVAGALGGTGRKANWDLAAELGASRELILAGGLGPDDVGEAIARVLPFGVDVASGVERRPGEKDPDAVRRFCAAARAARPG